ncbi:threonine/homoserine/homoserine lactone efflux protein [Algoriphagus iocasae]|uniref:Threonine/homoserine/homoserine lactone efflux protein n=1 Tax=Algoriphagus iocasae TaxID=1836499 RepID=A0A841ME15_9BACT|nr:LysE family translocator [Algoriphagus iocasae]MBB6325580.1 threonine/homoserine/homoserine lactone efflux protein [Algoriphagus iocasae]
MSSALIEGISMGLLLSAMVGPVFFTLIQSSLTYGFRYASVLALGILSSDTFYVLITYVGIKFLAEATYFEEVLGYVGGVILIGFGVSSLLSKKVMRPNSGGITVPVGKKRSAFLKGFSINGINPFVLLFWISIASLVQTKEAFTSLDILAYYTGILATVFSIDLIKAFIAKQLAHLVTPKIMAWMNKAVGFLLIGFGIRMLIYTYMG